MNAKLFPYLEQMGIMNKSLFINKVNALISKVLKLPFKEGIFICGSRL